MIVYFYATLEKFSEDGRSAGQGLMQEVRRRMRRLRYQWFHFNIDPYSDDWVNENTPAEEDPDTEED
jgi:hypothetical protein